MADVVDDVENLEIAVFVPVQLWLEVHDVRGRVKTVESMLKSHGYKVTVTQDDLPLLRQTNIFAVFATRR